MKTQNTLQVILTRNQNNKKEFLMLKRTESRGGFWQPITGRLEDEKPEEGAMRELKEETGIEEIIKISKISEFPNGQADGMEFVFLIEVDSSMKINLDCNVDIEKEHDEFKWCDIDEATKLAKWPQYKEALEKLK
ncbi:MAG: hypothetical protein CL811_04720 [Colwelliaceae bacterium]|nr:hypothetical protein [Colwelliaceae bacterium]|tara:strand:+ start:5943 stop:6347 length:405 start_codon:yes stop_codon:yes gene_type:complete